MVSSHHSESTSDHQQPVLENYTPHHRILRFKQVGRPGNYKSDTQQVHKAQVHSQRPSLPLCISSSAKSPEMIKTMARKHVLPFTC